MLNEASRPKRILIVEDEAIIAHNLGVVLLGMGYEVDSPVSRIYKAIQGIISDPPDAAVLDTALGKETSFPIAEVLAERRILFFFLTAYGEFKLPPALQTYPFLIKPIVNADLQAALESILTQRHRPGEAP